jgi:hypothetical protein
MSANKSLLNQGVRMPSVKLSDFQSAADKKYGDFEVHLPDNSIVSFVPALRLPKESRRKLAKAFDVETRINADEPDLDLYDIYKDVFRVSARQTDAFTKLEAIVGDDPAVWEELAKSFMQDTQAGESSPQ